MQNEGYTIKRIASIIGGEVVGNQSDTIIVEDILFDSRLLIDAENTLFFALNSGRNDGHKYIKDLYEKGVKAFVISRKNIENYDVKAQISTLQQYSDAVFVVVDDTFVALQTLAAYHRMQFDIPVVGITGSNGKTVVKEWLYQILSPSMSVCRSPKSYNSQIGVPLSVWQMNHTHDIAIFEAGISRPGEMEKLRDIIKPTIGVFTNIGAAHGKNFENVGQKIEEKLKLFAETNKLVYCSDNIEISSAITNAQIPAFSWSKTDKNADLFVSEINITDKTNIFAIYQNKKLNITIPFIDNASIENAINCWCVALLLNVPNEQIAERMAHLEVVEMRMELKAGVRNCLIINDSYNNDRNALAIALDFMNAQHHDNKVLILSDILQSEQKEEDLYKDIAQLIENKGVDTFIGIGPAISKNMDKACLFPTGQDVSSSKDKACLIQYFYKSTSDFLNNHPMKLFENQIVLLKGARSFEFERIMKVLQQKSHETVLEINLDNLIKNLNYYRGKLKKETKMMVMVKAFAYGSGNYEVSNALAFHHVDYLTVAYADEGVDLRNRGIKLPIMVMTPETNTFDTIILNDLEPDIYSFRCLSQLEDAINQLDRPLGKPVGIHIKVDTGMHRLGFLPEEIDTLIERVKANPSLRIMSVFSHFATSDMPEEDGFVKHQIEQFELMSSKMVAAFPYKIMRHLLNTAGITRFTDYQYDMVRLGIGVYGVAVVDEDRGKLHNVMSLKSTIKQIKEYGPGETIGYGRHGKITKPSRIAVIPIGYADGLRRQLGNGKACFWVNGKPAPIIGNICMDLTMIDVTGIDCQEDDTAVLFDDNHPIEIIAEACDTIPYEIMTRISQRVKRIYTKE